MNVPRETIIEPRTVRRLHLPRAMLQALSFGRKTQHRVPIEEQNSIVRPGGWRGLDLESGRVRIVNTEDGLVCEVRARCRFPSGDVRAVSVQPAIKPGDLYWVTGTGGTLARSTMVAEVVRVYAARLQDIGDDEVRLEGCDPMQAPTTPREAFRLLWDRRRRESAYWRLNPWVWILLFNVHRGNATKKLAELRGVRP